MTDATIFADVDQLAVITFTLPSLKVPVAVNCCVPCTGIVAVVGVTEIETSLTVFTVSVVDLGPSLSIADNRSAEIEAAY